MKTDRFVLSHFIHKQYNATWYNRKVFVDDCIKQLEEGTPPITCCPDRRESYVDCNACRVYFDDHDNLLRFEFKGA